VLDLGGNSITVGSVGLISGSIVNTSATAATLTGSSYMLINGTISVPLCGANVPVLKGTTGAVTLTAANTLHRPDHRLRRHADAWRVKCVESDSQRRRGRYSRRQDHLQLHQRRRPGFRDPCGFAHQLRNSQRAALRRANGAKIFSSTAAANSSALGWSDSITNNQVTIARTLYGEPI